MFSFGDLSLTGVDVPTSTDTPPGAAPELFVVPLLLPPLLVLLLSLLLPHPATTTAATATAAAAMLRKDFLLMRPSSTGNLWNLTASYIRGSHVEVEILGPVLCKLMSCYETIR
jgi:hypothetical protein